MNCLECRGACCETFMVPVSDLRTPNNDSLYWLKLHGTEREDAAGPVVEFECKCTALDANGLCSIYESRPIMCQLYRPGCQGCLETVQRRRTRKQYTKIREKGDPHPDELYGKK